MILEHEAEPQSIPPVESPGAHLPIGDRRSLMDVWRVLTKQRFTILTVTILFLAAAVWYAFRTPPVYESVSRIEIKPNQFASGDILGFISAEDEEGSDLQTQVRVLQSDSVLFQTAQDLGLSRIVAPPRNGVPVPPDQLTPPQRQTMIGIVRGGLSVSIVPNTRIVEIHYRNNDPKLATNIVNQLVETYSDEDLRTKFERTEHVSSWLEKKVDDLKQEASQTQRQLADYQRQHNIVGTDENNLTTQELERISTELDDAEADRIMKEARMRDFDSLSPDMMSLMGDNPNLATLRSQLTDLQAQRAQLAPKFGPKHPQMQQLDAQIAKVQTQIDHEVELARHQVSDEYKSAVGLEGDLRKRLGAQEEAAYHLNEDVAQYAILRHEAELSRDLYDSLQLRLKEAGVSAGLSAANITVVDFATVPFAPVLPQKRKALLFGFFGGLFVGCLLAFVIESIDDRLRTSEEVESASMLPSLAAIPHMAYGPAKYKTEMKERAASGAFQTPHQLITLWDPKSHGAEAYRGMRSSLLLSSIDNPPRLIVLTSAFPSEGKTTTALNLSIVLAQRGEQVLLVDADLRRGSLHRVFGLKDGGFGLSTALSQPGLLKELPAPFEDLPTLHVLPTGPLPPNPAEMLSSNRMEEQMRQWTKQFDRIVIDSAPLLAVSDTQSLAVRADAVVLVARAGVTRKRALIRARDLLWRVNAPVAGVVVNDVDLRLENFYTYRYGAYAKNYWYGYRQSPSFSDRAYGYEDDEQGSNGVSHNGKSHNGNQSRGK
jgi:polysaccharide biosynthesis transport protein